MEQHDDMLLSLECQHCPYVTEMFAPADLAEVNRRAEEHQEVCDGQK